VVEQYARLHQNLQTLDAADLSDPDRTIAVLNQSRAAYLDNLQLSGKFDLSLLLIQKYGNLLTQLSSDHFVADLSRPTTELGGNLDSIVTLFSQKTGAHLGPGLGSDLSKLILLAGQKLTRRKQTEALRQFVTQFDTLIGVATVNMVDVMDNGIKELLLIDSGRFASDARRMVSNESALDPQRRGLTLNRYQAAKFYYDVITAYLGAEALRAQVVRAALSLREAHAALIRHIQEKKDLKELIEETKKFVTDVQPLGPIVSRYVKLP
jgi:hypothetical protein